MARSSSSDSGGFLFKTGIFAVLAAAAFWVFNQFSGKKADEPSTQTELPTDHSLPTKVHPAQPGPAATTFTVPDSILPAPSAAGEIVHHIYYTLSYNEDHEQADWVAYVLTRDHLNENWVERSNTFRPDPDVRTESATPRDYNTSGYDKGHLCPAADMSFNEQAMDESFLMSNMSPQVPAFNMGIWRELEELTRDWARKFGRLYVVTGPILAQPSLGQIGFSKVTVPSYYYKVLLAPDQHRAIAFMLPNQVSTRPVLDYAYTIDQVEQSTGLDFFPQILKGSEEDLERALDKNAWPTDQARYQARLADWNKKK